MDFVYDSLDRKKKIASIAPDFHRGIKLRLPNITAAADSILRLTRVLGTEYELRLIRSCGRLKFRRLDTSCRCLKFWWLDTNYSCLHPTADLSFGGWIQVAADSIPRLTRVSAAGSELWLTRVPTADSILRLTRVPAAGYELQLIPSCG